MKSQNWLSMKDICIVGLHESNLFPSIRAIDSLLQGKQDRLPNDVFLNTSTDSLSAVVLLPIAYAKNTLVLSWPFGYETYARNVCNPFQSRHCSLNCSKVSWYCWWGQEFYDDVNSPIFYTDGNLNKPIEGEPYVSQSPYYIGSLKLTLKLLNSRIISSTLSISTDTTSWTSPRRVHTRTQFDINWWVEGRLNPMRE